jgi:hypothetical protein
VTIPILHRTNPDREIVTNDLDGSEGVPPAALSVAWWAPDRMSARSGPVTFEAS